LGGIAAHPDRGRHHHQGADRRLADDRALDVLAGQLADGAAHALRLSQPDQEVTS